jgi:hypothetical protein
VYTAGNPRSTVLEEVSSVTKWLRRGYWLLFNSWWVHPVRNKTQILCLYSNQIYFAYNYIHYMFRPTWAILRWTPYKTLKYMWVTTRVCGSTKI